MLKALLGIAALLGLCYIVADKEKLNDPAEQEKINRWARPLCFWIVGIALFLFFGYPLLFGDGQPLN